MKLENLEFGAPAAERDTNLVQYFIKSKSFEDLAMRKKTIVLGNRGSGKSALFKMLADSGRKDGSIILELNPEDYSYEMLQKTLISESEGAWAKTGAFTCAWKYLIFVETMKKLVEKSGKIKTGPYAKIYEYLRDNHMGHQNNPIAVMISYLKRFEGFKIGHFEAAIKARELEKLYKLEEIKSLFPYISEICKKQKVVVLVDELDRGYDSSEDAKAFVAGLFQASITINEMCPDLTVYVSLRKELYDSIPTLVQDAQKYRDIIEIVSWDEASLRALIASRAKYFLPELAMLSDEKCWNMIFSEVLDYRKTNSFNYMIDRTLYRPREIIQFCTSVIDKAKKVNNYNIDYSLISEAESEYSAIRTRDIANEYRFQYPGVISVFEVFRGRCYTMEREELESICLEIVTGGYKTDKESSWVLDREPDSLIDVLWEIGFIRAQAIGGLKAQRRSGSSYLGPHQIGNLNLRNIMRFHVHPMFRSFLGMKEAK